jgi:hypothetical protein
MATGWGGDEFFHLQNQTHKIWISQYPSQFSTGMKSNSYPTLFDYPRPTLASNELELRFNIFY